MRLAEGHLGSRRPLRVLPLTPSHRRFCLEWCHARGNWTAVEWNQVIFSDKSRFYLSSDDNRVRVGRPRGEHLNPGFTLQRHTAPTAGVMKNPEGPKLAKNGHQHVHRVSKLFTKVANLVAKKDAKLVLLPRFRQVRIQTPL
ncbi:transposable element Tcb1 transposase [Trichonephila clavipes]|nr:transposable element Tcb1 transposase [Trichonephila clavipes]